jgi:hypothetical protein
LQQRGDRPLFLGAIEGCELDRDPHLAARQVSGAPELGEETNKAHACALHAALHRHAPLLTRR